MKVDKITSEDLLAVEKAKDKIQLLTTEKKVAELEHQNLVLMIYIKYQLSEKDTIDGNGMINYHLTSPKENSMKESE